MNQAAPPSRAEEHASLRTLAISVTRGSSNNLFQVATLVRAATALDISVEVLFRDEALQKLHRDRLNEPEWAPAYAVVEPSLAERLRAADFTDMETFLRDAKEHGDEVHYWASADTIAREGLAVAELTPLLDGQRGEDDFDAAARHADALLAF